MSTLRALGAQLRSGRQAQGESQTETAAALGMSRQWLARVESGTGNPDLRQLFALCDHLGLHLLARPNHTETVAPGDETEAGATRPAVPAQFKASPGMAPDVDLDALLATFSGGRERTHRITASPGTPQPGPVLMSDRQLYVLMHDVIAGVISQNGSGSYRLEYDEDYRAADGLALSLSLPLTTTGHSHRPVRAYLQGLLPDNPATLDAWARRFGVSARNPFALLQHVGEECAGAIRLVRPERINDVLGGRITPLAESDIELLIRQLRADPTAAPVPSVADGQFSLAGAQSKFSLLRTRSGWAQAAGRYPSTHIVKPVLDDLFLDKELNEHVCLSLLRRCGLSAAGSDFVAFGEELAIVVTRYDRVAAGDADADLYLRVHQEDLCQAMGVLPEHKYRPGIRQIADLFANSLPGEVRELVAAPFAEGLLANWLLGGTDAHAKNSSLLYAPAQTRLAPLYDVISYLPYRQRAPRIVRRPGEGDTTRVRLAMAVGGQADALQITADGWRETADLLDLDGATVIDRGLELASHILEELPGVVEDVRDAGVVSPMLDELTDTVGRHVAVCRSILSGTPPSGHRPR